MDPLNIRFKTSQPRHCLITAIMLGLATSACGGATRTVNGGPDQNDARVLDLLEALRPSQAQIVALISDAQKNKTAAVATAAGLQVATDAPVVSAIELHPYLIDPLGNYVQLTTTTTVSEMADGTLAIIPYEIYYQDQTTALTGFLDIRYVWDGGTNIFGAANPTHTISQTIAGEGAYVSGTVYNQILDILLDDVAHNNGQLGDAPILAIDSSGTVYSSMTSADGTFSIGPLPIGRGYVISAGKDGFHPAYSQIYLNEAVLIENFDLDVMAIITNIHQSGIVFGKVLDLDGDPVADGVARLVDGQTGANVEGVLGDLANAAGEYLLVNVNLPSAVTYSVEALYFAAAGYSTPFTIDSQAGQAVERDVIIQNHKVDVVCSAGAASGAAIAITVAVNSETTLTATASDLDNDTITITWSAPDSGELYPEISGSGSEKTAQFVAPAYATSLQVSATASDLASWRECDIQIDVVE